MAATMDVEKKLKDITDCPICLETYNEPKILPCIHTFCMHCLRETGEKLNKTPGDKMPCPVCRKEFTVPETGFAGLQKNFFMDKLTEIKNILKPSSERNLCDACREDNESLVEADIPSAEMYCVQCHQKLCDECTKHHRKYKVSKNHKIISIEGFKSEDIQETLKTDSCEKHLNSLLEIYCSDCQEAVCAICFVENHNSHDASEINKVATNFRRQITENIDEFSSILPQLRQEEQGLDKYKTEFMRSTDEVQTQINERRAELKELLDKHADSLLSELDSIRQQRLKKFELNKESVETLLVYLESYTAYCLRLTTVGSASDICRAMTALDARTKELKHLHVSSGNSYYLSHVRLKLRDLQDRVWTEQNIVGELEEHEAQNLAGAEEASAIVKTDTLREGNLDLEKPRDGTSQQNVNKSLLTKVEEYDLEDNDDSLECMEINLDTCAAVPDSIELKCLNELDTILKSRLKEVEVDESSIHEKLKELKKRIISMLETTDALNATLDNERVKLMEVEKERATMVDLIKDNESNKHKQSKVVEDLKSQVVLLKDLVHGSNKQTTTKAGTFNCSEGVTISTTLKKFSKTSTGYKVFGMAILENEVFVVSNENVAIIYDLPTLKFKRRWKVPREGTYDDIKQCDTNKCLYMMKVEFELQKQRQNEIIRVDPNGNEIAAWSVEEARGQLSVTSESNILLTASSMNKLHEYAPDGKLVQVIHLTWDSGIEKPSHAIKLTSDHFLVCHGKVGDPLVRVCIVEKTGNVLKCFGDLWDTIQLGSPIYLDKDGAGNILVADQHKRQVSFFGSDLSFKGCLIPELAHYPAVVTDPKKVCFDKSNGRVFVVEHIAKYQDARYTEILDYDVVPVYKVKNKK